MPAAAAAAAAAASTSSGGGSTAQPPPQQPPQIDQQTIQERLLTREGGGMVTRGSLLKCAHRYRDFLDLTLSASQKQSALTADEVTAVQTAKEALQRELKLHNLEMQKVALVARAAESELDQYQQTTVRIENDAAAVREEIERLKTELGQERKVRRNREEYESLAKMANVRPARRVTEAKLAEVREEMDRIHGEEEASKDELEVRARQFQALMQTLNDLKSTIAEDEVKKRALEEAKAAADAAAEEEEDEVEDEDEDEDVKMEDGEEIQCDEEDDGFLV